MVHPVLDFRCNRKEKQMNNEKPMMVSGQWQTREMPVGWFFNCLRRFFGKPPITRTACVYVFSEPLTLQPGESVKISIPLQALKRKEEVK